MANLKITRCEKLAYDRSFKLLRAVIYKRHLKFCKALVVRCVILAPIYRSFIVVVDISAIIYQAVCYFAMRTSERSLC